jgi:3-oxoacyl-[acyl-carrier protein] reductase
MDLGLAGRVAMVAAASKGIGRSCALALAREGCSVSICARAAEPLEATEKELEQYGPVLAVLTDVTALSDLESWHQETIHNFGQVDILVTNTGGPPVARFMDLTDDQWHAGVESTLMNVVRLTRLVVPQMKERRWGRVIHLTSLVAKQPIDELTISSTLRAGISALTKTMANQFGPDNITVNAVLLGHFMTDRQEEIAKLRARESGIAREEYFATVAKEIPLRRIGDPSEVGNVVAFLASEAASYLTGVSLAVDGGVIRSTM